MNTPLLSVEQLSKHYSNGKQAIKAASFRLDRGESLGLVGESGCGKSTLARCLLQLEPISGGAIVFKGQPIQQLNEKQLNPYRRDMQMVFQNPAAALNPRLRIRDSLLDPYNQYSRQLQHSYFSCTSRSAFVAELLEAVELSPSLADCYPHELSGGQKQRVTIARAISIEPALIVLDEPTASLDVLSQGAILTLLEQLQRDLKLAYLFISHDLAAVSRMCSRLLVMREGEFVDSFTRQEMFAEDRHPYTKELISIF
ncbi:peptide ABC transporter ATPase [Paenibacillus sp. FSL R7-0273]|uniref:ABC transporter ATP-binding protein n=1 Tax=Paenibacillus sp. FSL R7-0273 TaxID=1536772 RepID=UPI0004F858E6|nr:dipeptide/oligopeptide/nickel ABC transporter ATP-binding protein [Paenibacillus sp. FSL R7-0273]AIQ46940.1 peptide ABC transporter ATPase [Paenibacillus sp. FSL R7-0273]OMF97300.1 dipeptide/oligopeptide/nickel ABC transporter ATP-binding protein [Paenibacillus sp. FSL R7-0273]